LKDFKDGKCGDWNSYLLLYDKYGAKHGNWSSKAIREEALAVYHILYDFRDGKRGARNSCPMLKSIFAAKRGKNTLLKVK
jgi:hypothetical protein